MVVMTPVPLVYEITDVPLNDVEEILLLKFVQSPDARKPLVLPLACVIESVLPENWRGPEIVVEMREPLAFAVTRVLVRFVTAKLEEVALVKVVLPENLLLSVRSVEEAAVIVKVPPAVIVVLLIVARVPVK